MSRVWHIMMLKFVVLFPKAFFRFTGHNAAHWAALTLISGLEFCTGAEFEKRLYVDERLKRFSHNFAIFDDRRVFLYAKLTDRDNLRSRWCGQRSLQDLSQAS